MPTGQPGKNVIVSHKVEAAFGTESATGAGAEAIRIHAGGGLTVGRGLIEDPEVRRDGQRSMARLGMKEVTGGYAGTLSVGTWNTFLQYLFRRAWAATALKFTCDGFAAHTSLATTANTVTVAGTDTFTTIHGVKVGDVIRLGAMGATVDNINAVVSGIDATEKIITVLGTPWGVVGADNNATFTVMKKLKNAEGTIADPMVRYSTTVEEYFQDIDESELFSGCRVGSLKLTFEPGGVAKVEFGLVGANGRIVAAGAGAPWFTTPTEYTSIGLVAVDASIYLAGALITTVTGGELTIDIGLQGLPVVGGVATPDVFEGAFKLTGSITAMRTLLTGSHLARFLAETDNVELSLLFVEPDAAVPVDFVHFFVPRLKYLGNSANLGDEGALLETCPVYGAAKATTTGYDAPCTMTVSTSA